MNKINVSRRETRVSAEGEVIFENVYLDFFTDELKERDSIFIEKSLLKGKNLGAVIRGLTKHVQEKTPSLAVYIRQLVKSPEDVSLTDGALLEKYTTVKVDGTESVRFYVARADNADKEQAFFEAL
jgi:hypothetical protein